MKVKPMNGFFGSLGLLGLLLALGCSGAKDSGKFAAKAAQGGLAEVQLGQLALKNGADPAVKEFGQRMVTDHSRANIELKTVASQASIQLPAAVNSDQQSMIDKLSKLSGAEFDKEYMSDMVKDHEEDVADFKTQSQDGNTAAIKNFAAKTLPTLQAHLEMAREAARKVAAR